MRGTTLSRYQIVEQIGAGGMGVVYRARDTHLERDVALKVLPAGSLADETARRRFRKEALALSQLNHPNVATVHDFDTRELESLERAYADRSHWLVFANVDPRLDELRANPRFADLAQRIEAGGRT